MAAVQVVWGKRQVELNKEEVAVETNLKGLYAQAKAIMDKIKMLSSQTVIKYMEDELMQVETEIENIKNVTKQKTAIPAVNITVVTACVRYFLQHLDYLLLQQSDPEQKANFFGLIYEKVPTYQEMVSVTENSGELTGVSELFLARNIERYLLVGEGGLEPPRACAHKILSLACIPISPLARATRSVHFITLTIQ